MLILGIGLALPRAAVVTVETEIDAPPATVFALVNDFRRVTLWSTRLDADPNARITYSGPPRGVGATMAWSGTVVGSGTETISASEPYRQVSTIINPGEAGEAHTTIVLAATAGGTNLRFRFENDYGFNLIGRYVALIVTGIFRREIESSLTSLRELAESLPRTDFSSLEVEELYVDAQQIAYLRTTSSPDPGAISEAMGEAYFEVLNFIDRHGLTEAGAPISIARQFAGADLVFDAAIPVHGVDDTTPTSGAGVRIGTTYTGPVVRVKHTGSYRSLAETHRKITAYLAALGIERSGDSWESYVGDPTRVAEAELVTYVYYPVTR